MKNNDLKDYVIIITSDERYSKMWHTQLVYAEFLSKNYTVFFINPPAKWTVKNIFNVSLKADKKTDNLTVLDYINRFPAFLKLFQNLNDRYTEYKVAKLLKHKEQKNVLIWHFDSFRNSFSNSFFDKAITVKRIYHVIDPFYKNPLDRLLCKMSDLLIITSPRNNQFYSDFSDKILNISQCLDVECQKKMVSATPSILPKTTNYFVILGTLSDDVNFDWLLDLLKIKDFKLVIIGKTVNLVNSKEKWDTIFAHPNVEYLGLLSPAEFYPVLKNATAGLILYNEVKRAGISSPLKVLNYLISEIPVVTNLNCEISELDGNYIYNANSTDEFSNFVQLAMQGKLLINKPLGQQYLEKISIEKAFNHILSKI